METSLSFVGQVRRQGEQMVITFPKRLHHKLGEISGVPYDVQVRLTLLNPREKEYIHDPSKSMFKHFI